MRKETIDSFKPKLQSDTWNEQNLLTFNCLWRVGEGFLRFSSDFFLWHVARSFCSSIVSLISTREQIFDPRKTNLNFKIHDQHLAAQMCLSSLHGSVVFFSVNTMATWRGRGFTLLLISSKKRAIGSIFLFNKNSCSAPNIDRIAS